MANRKLFHVIAIFFTFFVLGVAQLLKPKISEGFINCYIQQACDCGQRNRWEDCWNLGPEVPRYLILEEYNQCKLGEPLGNDSFNAFQDMFCNTPDDIRKECYFEVDEKSKEYVKNTALGLYGVKAAMDLEMTRKCLDPILSFCNVSPTDCISEG